MIPFEYNKIHCVDCYEAIKQLPDKSIDLIITDPPYEINHTTGGGMLVDKGIRGMFDDLVENDLCVGINNEILNEFMRVMKKPNIYIWCNKVLIPKLIDFFVIKNGLTFDIISWHKTNALPFCGSKYLTDTEYCLYFKDYGVRLNTTYDTAKTHYELPINVADKKKFEHSTIKPLPIIENFVINSSNEGDIILDTFAGSGTTAVAVKNVGGGRKSIGFEINPKWAKVANDRLNNIQADGQMTFLTM